MTTATTGKPGAGARPQPLGSAAVRGLTPRMLNHLAYVTHDVAATADFYTRILGMELASTIFDDQVPSTGERFPYFHIFFRMADGSTIAFFECTDLPPPAKSTHPAYDTFNHVALQTESPAELRRWRDWLVQNGVEVLGPVDHKGMIESIYFHDPNGIRLELTIPLDPDWNRHTEQGYADLKLWVETKERAGREGRNPAEALLEMIRDSKRRYEKTG
jgi:catechol 2,3-dioxygenase-like lactoylglutathione lyase family enzyme